MSVLVKRTSPPVGPSTKLFGEEHQVGSGLICGENLKAGDACFIASTGLVMLSGGSGVTALTDAGAAIDGYCAEDAYVATNDAVTLLEGIDFGYTVKSGSGVVTPGQSLYLDVSAATKGRLATTAGITAMKPNARGLTLGRIRVKSVAY